MKIKKRHIVVALIYLFFWLPLVVSNKYGYDSIKFRDIYDLWFILFIPLNVLSTGIFLYTLKKSNLGKVIKFEIGLLICVAVTAHAIINFLVLLMTSGEFIPV